MSSTFYIDSESLVLLANQSLEFDIILRINNRPIGFPSFKPLIKLKSNLFQQIFDQQPDLKYYNLGNFSREAVITWLRFVYNERVVITSETFIEVSLLASRYECEELNKLCHQLATNKITWKNALSFLNQYLNLEPFDEISRYPVLTFIKEQCLTVIDKFGITAILRPSLFRCDNKTINEFLKRDTFRVHEWTLFTALLLWVDNKCRDGNIALTRNSLRSLLGDAFYQIRFPLMRINELVAINDSKLALTKKEFNDILSFLLDFPKPCLPFPTQLRQNIGHYVDRFSSTKMVKISSYPQEIHQVDITVDRKIRFVGVGIFLPTFHHLSIGRSVISFQLWNTNRRERVAVINRRMIHGSMADQDIYPIVFTSCVYLEPNTRYSLMLVMRYTNWRANYKELVVISGSVSSSTLIATNDNRRVKFKIRSTDRRLDTFYNIKNGSNSKSGQFPRLFYDFE